ncbi:MAG: cation:proton antiporter [Gammaproteobacteria bacterium]|nr:cation:proton antiporter [Gammaproteobacteria bacterium]
MHHSSHVAELVGGIVALLLLAVAILALTKKLRLPFTVVLVLAGITLAQLSETPAYGLQILSRLEISPDLILYVFLPVLIFESTLHIEPHSLRHNLSPILTLAIPGLLLSTGLIGLIVWLATPLPLSGALLLGAILSATDPVAVVSIFRQLGAPERLTLMLEGESLFNDAASIVLARILIGVIAAGTVTGATIGSGILDFFILFFGGLLVGAVLGVIAALFLGLVESDPLIEIPLTTALAYLSFLLAEEYLGVSGVMATMGAGLVISGWGRVKISPSVRLQLDHFWAQMAFVANALIFLMLGLRVELEALWEAMDLVPWVILAMLIARGVLIYGLMPLVGRLPGGRPISFAYKTLIFWGGLRGAIAIAIVLSLPPMPYTETFIALVTTAVLFTLLVQGLTIEPLFRWLHLDRPTLVDRLALLERDLDANKHALKRIPQLRAGGLFSSPIAHRLSLQCEHALKQTRHTMQQLRQREMSSDNETALLYLRTLSEEKLFYDRLYAEGHLTEGAFRELSLVLTLQIDAIRYHGVFEHIHSHRVHRLIERGLYSLFDRIPPLARYAEWLRMRRLIRNYEEVWGHYQGSGRVLEYLKELAGLEEIPVKVMSEVRSHYRKWHEMAREQLDQLSEQFPEFVNSMQERLGKRVLLLAEADATRVQEKRGMLPHGRSEAMLLRIEHQLNQLRGQTVEKLQVDEAKLLRRVPLLRELDSEELRKLQDKLQQHTLDSSEVIIEQGALGDSLYLIARGVVRVSREEDGEVRDLGTLMAGDFFGEMALMNHESRNATIRTVTPCQLYELRRDDLQQLMAHHPHIAEQLERVDRDRQQELNGAQRINSITPTAAATRSPRS